MDRFLGAMGFMMFIGPLMFLSFVAVVGLSISFIQHRRDQKAGAQKDKLPES